MGAHLAQIDIDFSNFFLNIFTPFLTSYKLTSSDEKEVDFEMKSGSTQPFLRIFQSTDFYNYVVRVINYIYIYQLK